MNRYPTWKYILLLVVIGLAVLYALPNLFGESPSLQIAIPPNRSLDANLESQVSDKLTAAGLEVVATKRSDSSLTLSFQDEEAQLKARSVVNEVLGDDFVVALHLSPATPDWLVALGGSPMKLGLDLRGGVHFLMQVDMATAIAQREERYVDDFRRLLREARLRYSGIQRIDGQGITINFRDPELVDQAVSTLRPEFPELSFSRSDNSVAVRITELELKAIRDYAIQQNIITLRNRVNELGVAEPIVQRSGLDRIVVELPGIQDTAQAKRLIGRTATVELHAVDIDHDVQTVLAGRPVAGSKVYRWRDGRPELLKKRVILSGEHITGAVSGFDENGMPEVRINLDGPGSNKFSDFTGANIGKPMAVVFVEKKIKTRVRNGEEVQETQNVENVINVATIRGKLGRNFRITGLDNVAESRELALLLRAGSLAAPIEIIEERTIGPALGKENIAKGTLSVQLGLLLVLLFMAFYYKVFGLVADLALVLNIVFILALLSLIPGATLTLPGIAGIVLTVGMAVDANVLIFQRIREEINNGNSPQASIHAGYERAFSTIADANITTLIAAVVLFAVGTGPIKGFAVTLSVGIMTSMFTAIFGTRALVNLIYGGRKVKKLSI